MHSLLRFLLIFLSAITVARAEPIRIKGSDTLGARLMPQFCERYIALHPEISFQISAEGSSGGFECLLDRTADIGMSGREISPKEAQAFTDRKLELARWLAANDTYVIIVHPKNPLLGLTAPQVAPIFAGNTVNWRELGGLSAPISLYLPNTSSGAYADFQRRAVGGLPFAKISATSQGPDLPVTGVSRDESGIAYIGRAAFILRKGAGIKTLQIDGADASAGDQSYPFVRPLYYFTLKPMKPNVAAFLDWATRSDEARKIIFATGFFPAER